MLAAIYSAVAVVDVAFVVFVFDVVFAFAAAVLVRHFRISFVVTLYVVYIRVAVAVVAGCASVSLVVVVAVVVCVFVAHFLCVIYAIFVACASAIKLCHWHKSNLTISMDRNFQASIVVAIVSNHTPP